MKKGIKLFGLRDENNKEICEGDIVENKDGLKAKVCFNQFLYHFGTETSPAFGVYFDGDEGFYFSEHLLSNKRVAVKIIKDGGK